MGKGRILPGRLILTCILMLSASAALIAPQAASADTSTSAAAAGGATFRIYATREGLVGNGTSNGHVIQPNDHFVALPCVCALSSKDGNEFQVKIQYGDKTVTAPVWDVGPWNIDDNYWDPPEQRKYTGLQQGVPEATAAYYDNYNGGLDGKGRTVRIPAGIDIADGTFADLGMTDSDWVTVTFMWMQPKRPALTALPALPAGYEDVPTVYYGERPPLDPVSPKDPSLYSFITETQHNVPKPVMDYWYAHGGWRNIGLPISEVFRQVAFDGSTKLVQYFERQILELNLPDTGDKPVVTSGLIGYNAYAPQSAKQPIAAFDSTQNSWYFPQTQHSLANGFLAYWQQYGGLAAFGYPISQEFSGVTPDGRKYVAQIFERARFEWWPDKVGQPGDITQGLLVDEMLQRQGW
jgi:hypothetical protein